jgi:hypothetical protein
MITNINQNDVTLGNDHFNRYAVFQIKGNTL